MTNKLIVENFLIFKHIEIDINRYTVFIGPQASGKSVVAKILFLFYQFPETCFNFIDKNSRSIQREMVSTFKKIFPEKIWKNHSFTIELKTPKGSLSFKHENKKSLLFVTSEYYECLFNELKKEFDDGLKKEKEDISFNFYRTMKKAFHDRNWAFVNNGGSCSFIPADRAFFATLKDVVFTLIVNDVNLDYFIKKFGSNYELIKRISLQSKKIKNKQKELLNGFYKIKDSKEFIHAEQAGKSFDIELSCASSGQQELLPILIKMFSSAKTFYIVEEPEAHIYPQSQYELIRFIISRKVSNDPETAYLFTTHSPYILTTLNNLAYAGYLEKKYSNNKKKLLKLDKIYSKDERIPYGELTAYMFRDGSVKSIIDKETMLIHAEDIDKISDITESAFSDLMMLEDE